jgi:carboxymethylenebutenolidase
MDALGLSDDIREQADRLAAAGYLAFAPDLYSGRGAALRGGHVARVALRRPGPAYGDIEAARGLPARRARTAPGGSAIIGFCMGGGFALMCAPQRRLRRRRRSTTARSPPMRPSGSPARARSSRATAAAIDGLQAAAPSASSSALTERAGVAHDVKEYPDAGHSFLNRFNAGPCSRRCVHVAGFGYHHASRPRTRGGGSLRSLPSISLDSRW